MTAAEPKPIDPFEIYVHARRFMQSAIIVSQRPNPHLWAPQAVLQTFALELHLKCLHLLENPAQPLPRSHGLLELFFKLRSFRVLMEFAQEHIEQSEHVKLFEAKFPDMQHDALSILRRCDNLFERIRYQYENKPWSTDDEGMSGTSGIDAMIWAVDKWILINHPEWKERTDGIVI